MEASRKTHRPSPVAQAWNLAMFGNNHFFAFFNSSSCTDEILPGWELPMQWLGFFRIQDGG